MAADPGNYNLQQIFSELYALDPTETDGEGRSLKLGMAADMLSASYAKELATTAGLEQQTISQEMMDYQAAVEGGAAQETRDDNYNKNIYTMNEQQRLGALTSDQQHGRDLGMLSATGEQDRLNIAAQGNQTRLSTITQGEQSRLNIGAQGQQDRLSAVTQGQQSRLNIGAQGTQDRLNIGAQGNIDKAMQAAGITSQEKMQGVAGQQALAQIASQGTQDRSAIGKQGAETRATLADQASEDRTTIGAQGDDTRKTMDKEFAILSAKRKADARSASQGSRSF